MDTNLLLQNIHKHISLSEEESSFFTSLFTSKLFRRRTFVKQGGEVFQDTCFVNAGCLRAYTLDKNGIEHILQFAPPGWWMGDIYSSTTGNPGNLFIDAVDETYVLMLSKTNRERLFEKVPKFERFFRILIENAMVSNQQRMLDNLSLTAEERFEKFSLRYPALLACLPQKYIASYIGVTPEFFSKMRAAISKKK